MSFTLKDIVPWGRTFGEYEAMFSLSADDLAATILDCGGGPASFNAELAARGGRVVSLDPLYASTADEIHDRIDECFDNVLRETERNSGQFVWKSIESVEDLAVARRTAMNSFLADFRSGESRYVSGSLPTVPFSDRAFDLALCSHLLFLYSEHLDLDFHVNSILELCRVADEVRIFPILDLSATRSVHFDAVCKQLQEDGLSTSIQVVNYEFQKNGFEMLRVRA